MGDRLAGNSRSSYTLTKTMREREAQMTTKYGKTVRCGLALDVIEVSLSLPDC